MTPFERLETKHMATIHDVFAKAGCEVLTARVIADIQAVLDDCAELRETIALLETDLAGSAALDALAHNQALDELLRVN